MSEFNPENIDSNSAEVDFDEQLAVTYVNDCLSGSYNEQGVARWWQRPRLALGNKTPQEMWAMDRMRVIALARSIAGKT